MQISNGICRYERKYAVLNKTIGTVIKCHFWENPKHRNIQNNPMLRSGFFFANHARWWSRVLDLFRESRIRVMFRQLFPTPKTNFVNFKRRKTEVLKTLNWTFEVLALETFGIVQSLKMSWYQGLPLFLISVKMLALKFCKTCEKSFSANTLGDVPTFWIFFQDSRIGQIVFTF